MTSWYYNEMDAISNCEVYAKKSDHGNLPGLNYYVL